MGDLALQANAIARGDPQHLAVATTEVTVPAVVPKPASTPYKRRHSLLHARSNCEESIALAMTSQTSQPRAWKNVATCVNRSRAATPSPTVTTRVGSRVAVRTAASATIVSQGSPDLRQPHRLHPSAQKRRQELIAQVTTSQTGLLQALKNAAVCALRLQAAKRSLIGLANAILRVDVQLPMHAAVASSASPHPPQPPRHRDLHSQRSAEFKAPAT